MAELFSGRRNSLTPFTTALPLLGQRTLILNSLPPERDCGPKGVNKSTEDTTQCHWEVRFVLYGVTEAHGEYARKQTRRIPALMLRTTALIKKDCLGGNFGLVIGFPSILPLFSSGIEAREVHLSPHFGATAILPTPSIDGIVHLDFFSFCRLLGEVESSYATTGLRGGHSK